MRIPIAPGLSIDSAELEISFIQSSGPGGQNVNKVASAAQLRFDMRRTAALPEDIKARLALLAGHRLTRDGVIVITARRFRSQDRNLQDAIERLATLIRHAAIRPQTRRQTRPSQGARQGRLEAKRRRGMVKEGRGVRADLAAGV